MPTESARPEIRVNGTAAAPAGGATERPPASRVRRHVRLLVLAMIAALIGTAIVVPAVRRWLGPATPAGLLVASGRIEGRITTLSPKTSAWVVSLHADEGQRVTAGQPLATLDDRAQRERLRAAEESLGALGERLRAADSQLALTERQVAVQVEQATAAVLEADMRLSRARVSALQAQRDAERAATLVGRELIAPQVAEHARLEAQVADHAAREAEAARVTADKQLALARLGTEQLVTMRAERAALARQRAQAEAQLAEQHSLVADFAIRSPIDGTILTRTVERGERVTEGTPLFTLVDPNQLYVKIYVPEPSIGKVALGQPARVTVDAYPNRFFAARVSKVSQEAEFTPKNVETREERVKLVFAVEVALTENPGGVLKPGMPADAVIRWQPDAAWPAP